MEMLWSQVSKVNVGKNTISPEKTGEGGVNYKAVTTRVPSHGLYIIF